MMSLRLCTLLPVEGLPPFLSCCGCHALRSLVHGDREKSVMDCGAQVKKPDQRIPIQLSNEILIRVSGPSYVDSVEQGQPPSPLKDT